MPLSDVKIKNAKPTGKQYKLYDERGLFLIVRPAGENGGASGIGLLTRKNCARSVSILTSD